MAVVGHFAYFLKVRYLHIGSMNCREICGGYSRQCSISKKNMAMLQNINTFNRIYFDISVFLNGK